MKITFVTGNKNKLEVASRVLSKYGIDLVSEKIETPEIQSIDVSEISKFSAQYAAKVVGGAVIKTDAGYFIKSLNGFPGPFVKYINNWLSAEDILRLLEGKKDRSVEIIECLTYCNTDGEVAQFFSKDSGKIALKAEGQGSSMDQIIIRDKIGRVQALINSEVMFDYWAQNLPHFHKLGDFLKNKSN